MHSLPTLKWFRLKKNETSLYMYMCVCEKETERQAESETHQERKTNCARC